MGTVKNILGDITEIASDAIVNAANHSLLAGGGVCGAIHYAAGPELEEECRTLNGCEIGGAKTTKAYKLPAKYVIHACGPNYYVLKGKSAEKLVATYNSILNEADNRSDIKTITIPAISCGIYGYPVGDASKIAFETIKNWKSKKNGLTAKERFDNIVFVLFNKDLKIVFDEALKESGL